MDEEGQCKGFPKLNDSGGFELMHSIANCRVLQPLNRSINNKKNIEITKSHVGQGNLYIRPIQNNHATLKEKCKFCQDEFLLQDLRNHVDMCLPVISDYCDYDSSTSSSDVLPEVQIQIGLGLE